MDFFSYIKIGVLGGLILIAGFFYVQNLRKEAKINELILQNETLEHNLKIAVQTVNTMRKMEDSHEAIENAPNDDVADYLRTGVFPKRDSKKGAGVSTSAEAAGVRESD